VTGVQLIVGCRLDLEDFPSLLVYPTDRKAYARLCRLLTIGKGRASKGKCQLFWKDVQEWSEGLIAILLTQDPSPELATHLHTLRSEFGDRTYCALTRRFRPNDVPKLHAIAEAARLARVPEASWAIKALRDNTLPLFEDADRRGQRICAELTEPTVTLIPMTKGREVVDDYRSHGLSLRSHPLAFLRKEPSWPAPACAMPKTASA
jgi:DNA polymerase III alpha subunit